MDANLKKLVLRQSSIMQLLILPKLLLQSLILDGEVVNDTAKVFGAGVGGIGGSNATGTVS